MLPPKRPLIWGQAATCVSLIVPRQDQQAEAKIRSRQQQAARRNKVRLQADFKTWLDTLTQAGRQAIFAHAGDIKPEFVTPPMRRADAARTLCKTARRPGVCTRATERGRMSLQQARERRGEYTLPPDSRRNYQQGKGPVRQCAKPHSPGAPKMRCKKTTQAGHLISPHCQRLVMGTPQTPSQGSVRPASFWAFSAGGDKLTQTHAR
jgi:hypothetical protein